MAVANSSLLRYENNYGRKKFYSTGPWCQKTTQLKVDNLADTTHHGPTLSDRVEFSTLEDAACMTCAYNSVPSVTD